MTPNVRYLTMKPLINPEPSRTHTDVLRVSSGLVSNDNLRLHKFLVAAMPRAAFQGEFKWIENVIIGRRINPSGRRQNRNGKQENERRVKIFASRPTVCNVAAARFEDPVMRDLTRDSSLKYQRVAFNEILITKRRTFRIFRWERWSYFVTVYLSHFSDLEMWLRSLLESKCETKTRYQMRYLLEI